MRKAIGTMLAAALLTGAAKPAAERQVTGDGIATVTVNGVSGRVRLDPAAPAMPGAGRRLAAAFGGRLDGETGEEQIAFGIKRPVRAMTLARPLAIGPLSIGRLGVRTADFGTAAGIPDASAPAATGPDPDEVVVVARSKRNTARDRIAIGADQLFRCSSIVFDKPARQIRLTCR